MTGTYVLSDVHGHLDDLRAGLRTIGVLDRADRWTGDTDLWVLGDLVDRGPDGIGVIRLLRSLQEQAPHRVHVLLGNHEALAIGYHRFPDSRFGELWLINGGRPTDQAALTDEDLAWLVGLPALALVGDALLAHADTTDYLAWGSSVEEVNATVAGILAGDDPDAHVELFAALTSRYDFLGEDGGETARMVLDRLGGSRIVHGHSIIGSLLDVPSFTVEEPLVYADGLVMAIDGGRYDGGPLLFVPLEPSAVEAPQPTG